jgi:hypothetical protein
MNAFRVGRAGALTLARAVTGLLAVWWAVRHHGIDQDPDSGALM